MSSKERKEEDGGEKSLSKSQKSSKNTKECRRSFSPQTRDWLWIEGARRMILKGSLQDKMSCSNKPYKTMLKGVMGL